MYIPVYATVAALLITHAVFRYYYRYDSAFHLKPVRFLRPNELIEGRERKNILANKEK